MFLGLTAVVLTFVADQLSKWWINSHIFAGEPAQISSFFNIVNVWNSGVSFSMFNNYGEIGRIVLAVLALAVCGFLLHWMRHETNRLKLVSLGMIIGGALGNVADRVRFGAVLDFLDFHVAQYHWPSFNLADTFIFIGACILIGFEIFNGRKDVKK